MSGEFNPGDLVQLKAGGPVMVVDSVAIGSTDAVWCSWFSGAKHNKEKFALVSLQVAPEEGK